MDKKALLFGVTGQVASYLAEQLLYEGFEVMGVARRVSSPNLRNLHNLTGRSRFTLESGDVTDPFSVSRLVSWYQPDHIYNFSAQSQVHVSFNQPGLTWDVVAKGPLNILEVLRGAPPHYRERVRFLQASSSEMFGGNFTTCRYFNGERDEVHYQDEQTPFAPNSPYAVAKLAAHDLCRIYRQSYGLFACTGIFFNMESPRRGPDFVTKKIVRYVARFVAGLEKEPLRLGNLAAQRDWTYAPESMQAARLIIDSEKPDDFVVASGETHSIEELLGLACQLSGIGREDLPLEVDPQLVRPCEVPFLRGCPDKINKTLGWQAKTSFPELIRLMVAHEFKELGRPYYPPLAPLKAEEALLKSQENSVDTSSVFLCGAERGHS